MHICIFHSRSFEHPVLFVILNDTQAVNPKILNVEMAADPDRVGKGQRKTAYADAPFELVLIANQQAENCCAAPAMI
jgi:hypothetical protein